MTALKYSRQRESIKNYLLNTSSHPTADMVYLHVKETFPNISLGTVYRNLNLLVDMGEIIKITTPDGADRFDGCTTPHYHFFCTDCGCMMDLDMEPLTQINTLAGENFPGKIEAHTITFYGRCESCMQRSSKTAAI